MTDVKDTEPEVVETAGGHEKLSAPALDGSVDALVANLRAAKEQLAELLNRSDAAAADAEDDAQQSDRSAA